MENFETDFDTILEKALADFSQGKIIPYEEIPAIDLYMDQITAFLDDHLQTGRANPSGKGEPKTLTKTMINNYTKDKVLPPPNKKKYSKTHMLLMILVFNLKSVLSLSDIQTLLQCVATQESRQEAYKRFTQIQQQEIQALQDEMERKQGKLQNREDLLFLILSLTVESSLKKQLAEKLIDGCFQDGPFQKPE